MKLLEFFQEANGGLSSVRLFGFLIVICTVIDWQHAIWTIGRWSPDWQVLTFVAGVLGIKVWQRGAEQKPAEQKPVQPGVPQ